MGRGAVGGLVAGWLALAGCEPGQVGKAPTPPPETAASAASVPTAPPTSVTPSPPAPQDVNPRRVDLGALSVWFPIDPGPPAAPTSPKTLAYEVFNATEGVRLRASVRADVATKLTPEAFVREILLSSSKAVRGTYDGVRVEADERTAVAESRFLLADGTGSFHQRIIWLSARGELYTLLASNPGEAPHPDTTAFLTSARLSDALR